MTVRASDYSSLQFSTRKLPVARRTTALRDLFDRSVQLEIEADPDTPVEMEMLLAPGLRRAKMLSSLTARMSRPASMLADGEDTICLIMQTGGQMAIEQGRQEGVPQQGDGVLLVYREPAVLHFSNSTYVSVRVPFSAIAMLSKNVDAAAALRIPREVEALSLLRAYVEGLPQRIADPRLGKLSATHIYDLMSLAIGATREGGEIARQRGVRAARLEAIKAALLRDPTLDIDHLAARHNISPRYIQMLFEQDGTTFSEFALERKLEAARSMLVSPRHAAQSIAAIAFEAGFGDISHFNRRFRRRYGATPSEMRAKN